jgi:1,2-diacylglycerol 3-beta-glucosyltransferase
MTGLLETPEALLLLFLGLCLFYLAALTLLALVMRGRRVGPAMRQRRFAVVVPAHNEEAGIAATLESLKRIDYPAPLWEIIVIADNCTDRTAAIAREAGVTALERNDTDRRGKGFALRWCFDRLLAEDHPRDGVVVVDADTEPGVNMLSVMNDYLEAGARVIQVSDMVRPLPGAWSSEMTRLGFTLYNLVRPLGRKAFGGSAGLKGNGMCFTLQVLKNHPWDAYSRAEDLEYGLRLLLEGIPVTFAPEATILATMPAEASHAESQRARWEGGRLPLIRRYWRPLLDRVFRKASPVALDALIELLCPALVNMLAISLLCAVVNVALVLAGVAHAAWFLAGWVLLLFLGLVHLFLGIYVSGDAGLFRLLIHLPRFILWKLVLYLKLLLRRRRSTEWVRTTREGGAAGPMHRDR